ncbi:MAG: tRNA lysidine(34) synthetase TilS [Planctomycetes bacterium]|nr:tRNA lysidine(34) synthetase TilS [Planctomycetota bacterium]
MQQAAGAALWREASRHRGPIVVAVSGGMDSVLLLHALVEARAASWPAQTSASHPLAEFGPPEVICAHVHHGVRGDAAAADAAFVERLATDLGVRYVRLDADPARVWKRGVASEGRLRSERYRVLGELAAARGCGSVFVAHHRDDRVESIVLAATRGAGLRGLAGMPRRRPLHANDPAGPWLVRPWFDLARETLRAEAQRRALRWCEDATNADLGPRRNRVRHVVLPRLRVDLGAAIDDRLVRLSRVARVLARRASRSIDPDDGDAVHARCEALAGIPIRKHASLRIQELVATRASGSVDLAPGVRVRVRDGGLDVERGEPPIARAEIRVRTFGERAARIVAAQPASRLRARLRLRGFLYLDLGGSESELNAAANAPRFRTRAPGDRIDWPGLARPVRLKTLFASHHVPRAWRDHRIVVDVGGRIAAIEGLGTAAWARVTVATRTLLRITIRRSDDAPQAPWAGPALPS